MNPSELVREFHRVYDMPVYDSPHRPSSERVSLRVGLILEEFCELLSGVYDSGSKTWTSIYSTTIKNALPPSKDPEGYNEVEVADALADLVYVIYGMALELGIPLDDVLEEVHRSNLSKLGEDGKPIYREDGKVMKGPNFFEPNIRKVLRDHHKPGSF